MGSEMCIRDSYNSELLEELAGKASIDTSRKADRARGLTKIPAKFLAMQVTGGSTSTRDGFEKMRLAGAAARAALLKAAAKRLDVKVADLKTEGGAVIAPSGERLAYTALAADAAKVKLPKRPKLKPQSDWKLLGKSLPRLDMVGKATGTAEYGIDVRLPDMLYASVKMGPIVGAKLKSYDASNAKKMNGVQGIVSISDGVAVLARNSWAAMQAAQEITAEFDVIELSLIHISEPTRPY